MHTSSHLLFILSSVASVPNLPDKTKIFIIVCATAVTKQLENNLFHPESVISVIESLTNAS